MKTEAFGHMKNCLVKAEDFYQAGDEFMYGVLMNEIIKRLYVMRQELTRRLENGQNKSE